MVNERGINKGCEDAELTDLYSTAKISYVNRIHNASRSHTRFITSRGLDKVWDGEHIL